MSHQLSKEGALNKHRTALIDAEFAFLNERYDNSVSRAYFSMFYIAISGLKSYAGESMQNKTHNGLMTMVSRELVDVGILEKDAAKLIRQVWQLRNMADNTDEEFSKDRAWEVLGKAKTYASAMQKIIDSGLTKSSQ